MGGDVEAGLGIAEMIASLGKTDRITGPWRKSFYRRTVGCICRLFFYCPIRHDDYSSGAFFWNVHRSDPELSKYGAYPGLHYPLHCVPFSYLQERIVELMLDSTQLVKDVGTMLEGEEAVREGMIDEVGGIHEAFQKLHELIDEERRKKEQEKPDHFLMTLKKIDGILK